MQSVLFLIVGLIVGAASGALGIGGGILLVPALMMIIGQDEQLKAQGITLAVLSVPVVLPGVIQYFQRGHLEWNDIRTAAWIAIGFAAGTYGGAWGKELIPLPTMRLLFGFMLFYVAGRFLMAANSDASRGFKIIMSFVPVLAAWIAYVGLRYIGRKTPRKPQWPDTASIGVQEQRKEPEYYI